MHGYNLITSWNCACMNRQTVASAVCRVGSQEFHSWVASLPLVSLLIIVIPTPFKFLFISYLLIFNVQYDLNWNLNLVFIATISLCMCHTHFCNWGALFLHCSITFKRSLTLPWTINRGLQSISLALICFLERLCGGTK